MKRFVQLAAAVLLAAPSSVAYAQDVDTTITGDVAPERPILGRPSFLLQPSAIITNAVSAPGGSSSQTEFLARFTTVVPTFTQFLSLVALMKWTPFADNPVDSGRANSPAFVYGGIIPIVPPAPDRWLAFDQHRSARRVRPE